jgi:glycosyltransferase involved in cell wall biosynthesis
MPSPFNAPIQLQEESAAKSLTDSDRKNNEAYHFSDITLLITHYNRSKSLERLLIAFRDLNCHFASIIVSDDGSKDQHVAYAKKLQEQFDFELITAERNRGLGNNINKGQDAVKTPYTLYIQEDFIPSPIFPVKLTESIQAMNERKDVDMVRFYSYFKYPHLKPLPTHNGFSEMIFSPFLPGYKKFYYYSDHPHLRRSNFLKKFGRYKEGVNPERTEYHMMMSFLQKGGRALYYDDYRNLFEQANSSSEPSTVRKNFWRNSQHLPIVALRELYRHVRFNMDYLFLERLSKQ